MKTFIKFSALLVAVAQSVTIRQEDDFEIQESDNDFETFTGPEIKFGNSNVTTVPNSELPIFTGTYTSTLLDKHKNILSDYTIGVLTQIASDRAQERLRHVENVVLDIP